MTSASLKVIMGPMFSGKTSTLINIIDNFEKTNKEFITIKPDIDNRYSYDNFIISHNKEKKQCYVSNNLGSLKPLLKSKNLDYIIIDEAQFFDKLKEFCCFCLETLNINIIVAGLDGDYKRNRIGHILDLIPLADTVIKLKSVCYKCKEHALFSHRLVQDDSKILVGSNEYIPLCRACYINYNNLNLPLNT
jgi:thymidine kinase